MAVSSVVARSIRFGSYHFLRFVPVATVQSLCVSHSACSCTLRRETFEAFSEMHAQSVCPEGLRDADVAVFELGLQTHVRVRTRDSRSNRRDK